MDIDELIEECGQVNAKSQHAMNRVNDDTGELFYQQVSSLPRDKIGVSKYLFSPWVEDPFDDHDLPSEKI